MEEQIFQKLYDWLKEYDLPGALEPETLPAQVPTTVLSLTQSRDLAVMEDVLGNREVRTRFVYSLRVRLPIEVGREEQERENRQRLDGLFAHLRREIMNGNAPIFGENDRLTLTYPRLESLREGTGVYSSNFILETTFEYRERMNTNGTESD